MSISESDWKYYKELYDLVLERFCQGVLADPKPLLRMKLYRLTLDT